MLIPMQSLIFYVFASLLACSALMVILARDTVHAALFLVLAFFASAALWLILQAEFLALILVLVYVGAVMTLFLFVVMTLNVRATSLKSAWHYAPFGLAIIAAMVAAIIYISGTNTASTGLPLTELAIQDSNTLALGRVLYTQYAYVFELAGILLLVAIIAAIVLASPVARERKIQIIAKQVTTRAKDRIRWVDL